MRWGELRPLFLTTGEFRAVVVPPHAARERKPYQVRKTKGCGRDFDVGSCLLLAFSTPSVTRSPDILRARSNIGR